MIENVVARDGVERFRDPCFQQLADSTMDTKDRKDTKDSFCVRFVCGLMSVASESVLHLRARQYSIRHDQRRRSMLGLDRMEVFDAAATKAVR